MAIRNICTLGDEVLRKKCRRVETIDERTRQLLTDMADTLHATDNGVGLAAPQIGVLRRLVVIDMGDSLLQLVNPEVLEASGTRTAEEGCLSLPGRWATVVRPKIVKVRAQDETGKELLLEAQDEFAKCLCHEIDHLDGILFIDRAQETDSLDLRDVEPS